VGFNVDGSILTGRYTLGESLVVLLILRRDFSFR